MGTRRAPASVIQYDGADVEGAPLPVLAGPDVEDEAVHVGIQPLLANREAASRLEDVGPEAGPVATLIPSSSSFWVRSRTRSDMGLAGRRVEGRVRLPRAFPRCLRLRAPFLRDIDVLDGEGMAGVPGRGEEDPDSGDSRHRPKERRGAVPRSTLRSRR